MIAGDTTTVLSGDYSTQRVSVTKSGSSGAPITYQAQTGVTMKGFAVSADYISIKGFTITDLDNLAVGIQVDRGGYCDIENNTVKFSTMGGISLKGLPANPTATHDCIVKNNTLYRNGMFGLEIMGQNHVIESNDISQTIQHHPCNITYANVTWLDANGVFFTAAGIYSEKITFMIYPLARTVGHKERLAA
jgi:parallel beta-helix repeat protein